MIVFLLILIFFPISLDFVSELLRYAGSSLLNAVHAHHFYFIYL